MILCDGSTGVVGGGGSLNEFLRLEEAAKVEDLPGSQSKKAAHGEDAEVQDTRVGRFCGGKYKHCVLVNILRCIHSVLNSSQY